MNQFKLIQKEMMSSSGVATFNTARFKGWNNIFVVYELCVRVMFCWWYICRCNIQEGFTLLETIRGASNELDESMHLGRARRTEPTSTDNNDK